MVTLLSGTLDFVGLPHLLGLLAESRLGGQLAITHRSAAATISLERGQVVGATFGAETGLMALDAIPLLTPTGAFAFTEGSLQPDAFNLMIEPGRLAARLQELETVSNRLTAIMPSPWSVLVRSTQAANDDLVSLERGALALWANCNGRTIFELANGDGLLSTVRWTIQLVELGLVECKQPAESAAPVKSDSEPGAIPEPPADATVERAPESRGRKAGSSGAWARWRRRNGLAPKLET